MDPPAGSLDTGPPLRADVSALVSTCIAGLHIAGRDRRRPAVTEALLLVEV